MIKGIAGADSLNPVTPSRIADAGTVLAKVAFWGRYFRSPASSDYSPSNESALLHDRGIRVLPIARQTRRVNGTYAEGSADGQANAKAVLEAFGANYLITQGGVFLIFLDVEDAGKDPPLSSEYWKGWTAGLAQGTDGTGVRLKPALYVRQYADDSWKALQKAMQEGAPCEALYVAHWCNTSHCPIPPPDWSDAKTHPMVPLSCPVYVWQYQDGLSFDCDELNPSFDAEVILRQLILPPGPGTNTGGGTTNPPTDGTPTSSGSPIPPRPAGAMTASDFIAEVRKGKYSHATRDRRVLYELSAGNMPSFFRNLVDVTVKETIDGVAHTVTYRVMPDYLSVGSDDDYMRMPMSPLTAQAFGDAFGFMLPTPKMVEQIHHRGVKLGKPVTYDCTEDFELMVQINDTLQERLRAAGVEPGALVGGIKKDVVTSTQIARCKEKQVLYGWFEPDGSKIQTLFPSSASAPGKGHDFNYMDYSHGLRMISKTVTVDGKSMSLDDLLADPKLCQLVSDEGVVPEPHYIGPTTTPLAPPGERPAEPPPVTPPPTTTPLSVADRGLCAWHSTRIDLAQGVKAVGQGHSWEVPDGSNRGPLVEKHLLACEGQPGYPWCGCLDGFNYVKAGFDTVGHVPAAWNTTGKEEDLVTLFLSSIRLQYYFLKSGSPHVTFVTQDAASRPTTRDECKAWLDENLASFAPQPGDVLLLHTSKDYSHVGMVSSYDPSTHELVTYEGNIRNRAGAFRWDLADPSTNGFFRVNMIARFRPDVFTKPPQVSPSGPSPDPLIEEGIAAASTV